MQGFNVNNTPRVKQQRKLTQKWPSQSASRKFSARSSSHLPAFDSKQKEIFCFDETTWVCFMSRCPTLTGNSIRHRCFYKRRATPTPCMHSSSSRDWSKLQFTRLHLTVNTPKTPPCDGNTKLKGIPGNIVLCACPSASLKFFSQEFFFFPSLHNKRCGNSSPTQQTCNTWNKHGIHTAMCSNILPNGSLQCFKLRLCSISPVQIS